MAFFAFMSKTSVEKTENKDTGRKNRAAEVANTLEWLITAFILAFIFRAFIMEAFRIPTGSMAETLMGAHFRLRCSQCGFRYNYGFIPEKYGLSSESVPAGNLPPANSRCPSCGYYRSTSATTPVVNGDRILVLKCLYQFFEPKQWDVIVFKNPLDPRINYIKRLVGRPGETVEIVDGDVYINGQISRKPPNVQDELWMAVYDNDYQPARPIEPSFNGHRWQQPLKNVEGSKWTIPADSPARFTLDSPVDQINTLLYDTLLGNNFRGSYAYDDAGEYELMPYCSDLMVRLYVRPTGNEGSVGIELSKYRNHYKAWVDFSGEMVIASVSEGKETVLVRSSAVSFTAGAATLLKFANVDHQLKLQFGKESLAYDLGRSPDAAGPRETEIEPQAKIFGSGKLMLSHIAIFRDIHYTAARFADSPKGGRAIEGNPLALQKDEFFVLGDNSPNSADGRWWNRPGKGNGGISYREGIVPREYLVGKALFVYWPGGFKPFVKSRLNIIPNVGQMRFIYGGSDKTM